MKWIIFLFLFYNSVVSLAPGWIGCVFTPHTPCEYTRTIKCRSMVIKDEGRYLSDMVEGSLVDALNNLARLSDNYMRYDSTPQNSSIASCNVGNIYILNIIIKHINVKGCTLDLVQFCEYRVISFHCNVFPKNPDTMFGFLAHLEMQIRNVKEYMC